MTTTAATTTTPPLTPGSWTVERSLDRVVHVFDLPRTMTGDSYLTCAGSGNSVARGAGAAGQRFECSVVDRQENSVRTLSTSFDLFCTTAIHDQNGDLILAGGTGAYPAANTKVKGTWGGLDATFRFDVSTGEFVRLGNMAYARWYPEIFKDQSNNVFVHGGQHNGVQIPWWEQMTRGSTTWQVIPNLSYAMNSYAAMELIASDTFAFTGAKSGPTTANKLPFIIDMRTRRRTTTPGLRQPDVRRSSAELSLYPAQSNRVLVLGGGTRDGKGGTTAVDLIDYSVWPGQVPSFQPRASLPLPTVFPNVVNLPNGQVFLAGGSRAWRTGDILQALIYDPVADTWTPVAPHAYGRNYHAALHVNLDGSVSLFGGNPGAYFESRVEVYRPWYFDLPRPAIGTDSLLPLVPPGESLPVLAKGGSYDLDVTLPEGAFLGVVTLDGARASTHTSSDPGQMMFDLPATLTPEGRVNVQVPDHVKLTAGAYKLTVNTHDRVPSTSVWVRVSDGLG